MKPAQYIIKIFGGIRPTAKALSKAPSTIHGWITPKTRGGTGGKIPGKNHQLILKIAKRRGLDITPADIIFGRK